MDAELRGPAPTPVQVDIFVHEGYRNNKEIKVQLMVAADSESQHEGYMQIIEFTKEELNNVLPVFLRESDLTVLRKVDPIRIAIIEALSKLSDAKLNLILRDILAAKTEHKPTSAKRL